MGSEQRKHPEKGVEMFADYKSPGLAPTTGCSSCQRRNLLWYYRLNFSPYPLATPLSTLLGKRL